MFAYEHEPSGNCGENLNVDAVLTFLPGTMHSDRQLMLTNRYISVVKNQ